MAKSTEAKALAKFKRSSKGAWNRSRGKEPKARGNRMPAGINRGVCQLSNATMGLTKKGNPYFRFEGVCLDPEEHKGVKITINHWIQPTENKTIEDKTDELSSDLHFLGVENVDDLEEDDLPGVLEDLKKRKPKFLFNTWDPGSGDVMAFIQEGEVEEDDDEVEEEEEEEEGEDEEEEVGEEDEPEDEGGEETEESGEEDEEVSEADGYVPEKGDVVHFKATPRGKPLSCTIKSVDEDDRTVVMIRNKDDKKFEDVPWDDLIVES